MEEFEKKDLYEESSLTKEEILEKSRAENKKGDECEKSNMNKATAFSVITMGVLIIATWILECVFCKKIVFGYSLIALCWGMGGTIYFARGILNRKPGQILLGIMELIVCVMNYSLFIANLLKIFG